MTSETAYGFTRGWTLQELLAPKSVVFFSSEGIRLGDKISLVEDIHSITGIAVDALLGGRPLSDFSVSERLNWAAKRRTSRKEDEAYSLLGMFDISMPLIYGERERALTRLREQIDITLQGPGLAPHLGVHASETSIRSHHPVKKNYRKVYVTVIHWEADELQDTVQKIFGTFRTLYHYEVREIRLPHRHKVTLSWPWLEDSVVDERDLQIMYYLGNTMRNPTQSDGILSITASPARQPLDLDIYPADPDPYRGVDQSDPRYWERFPNSSWLSNMVGIPQLCSDVVIVLDCFVGELGEYDAAEPIPFLLDDDYSWARYLVLFAGYSNPATMPGQLSDKLMSTLEKFAVSGRFYAREGLITTGVLRSKLEAEVRFEDNLTLYWFGNNGKDFIHLSSLAEIEETTMAY